MFIGWFQVQKRGREPSEVEVGAGIEHGAKYVFDKLEAELEAVSFWRTLWV